MQNIKNLAYRFLTEAQIKELSISVSSLKEILRKQNIYLFKYSELDVIKDFVPGTAYNATLQAMEENEAIALSTDKISIIMYSDDLPHGKKMQKIYHELGHIKAEHKRSKQFMFTPNEEQEREADAFSLYVMAPPCVMKAINISSADECSYLTGLNIDYARKALILMKKEKSKNTLETEKNLLRIFEPFINANKQAKVHIKKIITASVIILGICLSSFGLYNSYSDTSANPPITPVSTYMPEESHAPDETVSTSKVWKAKTGNIYHTDSDCYHIPKTARTMDLEDAINSGYRKCKDCKK